MSDSQKWFDNKKQNLDVYESVLMREAGCMEAVLRGNVFFSQRICTDRFLTVSASQNPVADDLIMNLKENFVILASMISRVCVENGLAYQESLRVFTLYCRSLDFLQNEKDITARFNQLIMDYCRRMRERIYEQNKSAAVIHTMRYLTGHFNEHPVLSDLAAEAGISASRLSRVFHEETGSGIAEWSHKIMCETAGLLIRYTDDSISRISEQMGCSSVSSFIQIFSTETGRTPNRYRQEFRMNFSRQITAVTDDYLDFTHNSENITLTGYYLPRDTVATQSSDDHLMDQEYALYDAILEGDADRIIKHCPDILTYMEDKTGVLSEDQLTDERYHFLIVQAIIMRLCIEYRLNPSDAYHLSYWHLSRMQEAETSASIHQLMNGLIMAFTREMQNLHTRRQISEPIRKCIEYIYSHTSEKIRTQDLARISGKSVSWIAHTFPKETGISVKDYVQREKIASARNLLHYTDLSFSDIASRLSFSSQSHFTLVFHNVTGETPGEWRRKIRASENNS